MLRNGVPKNSRPAGKRIVRWVLKGLLAVFLLSSLQVLALRFWNPPCTVESLWRWTVAQITGTPYQGERRIWRPLSQVSLHLKEAVLAGEDQRFLLHHGFDLLEIQQALRELLHSGRLRGASTISMQTARMVFLPWSRSLWRKLAEIYYTFLIELFWSKGRILEVYLNTVDWGDGIVGAEAAARKYFGKPASYLSREQAAMLAAALPNPHQWKVTRPGEKLLARQRAILKNMRRMPAL